MLWKTCDSLKALNIDDEDKKSKANKRRVSNIKALITSAHHTDFTLTVYFMLPGLVPLSFYGDLWASLNVNEPCWEHALYVKCVNVQTRA